MDEFDRLESLVNKSLIQHIEMPGGISRFTMLETLHEYAWKQLEASLEAKKMHRRHAEYFVNLVERAEPELRLAGHSLWMDRLGSEENNLHAALEWTLGDGDTELGMRLVASLRDFWVMSGRFAQGQNWTQRALKKSSSVSFHLQVRVLIAAAGVLYVTSRQELQKQLLEEAVRLARVIDDRIELAWALVFLSMAYFRQRTSDDKVLSFSEEALSIFRELGHKPGMVQALNVIGELWGKNDDDERAKAITEECLMLVSETGEARREAMLLFNLGHIAMRRAEIGEAVNFFGTGLTRSVEAGHDKRLILTGIVLLAGAIGANGESERAARLFGAAETLFEPKGVGVSPVSKPEYERALAFVRDQLGKTRFLACWNEGRAMSLEQAVTSALESGDSLSR
jgi:non-specific serine/threonine protein kinase